MPHTPSPTWASVCSWFLRAVQRRLQCKVEALTQLASWVGVGGGGPEGRTAGEVGGNRSVRASLQECRRHWGLLNRES